MRMPKRGGGGRGGVVVLLSGNISAVGIVATTSCFGRR